MNARVERYGKPKEISATLERDYALTVTSSYIAAALRASVARGDGLLVAGQARPSEVLQWLRAHPEFRRDHP